MCVYLQNARIYARLSACVRVFWIALTNDSRFDKGAEAHTYLDE